ncbi:PHB depolymerase family esterase [Testicularia cyperi]|uniref:Carboxylic ester hydrolase n=1 Tax=Testicularia cyperi TaxID=1882483 RepID=A0A317XJJ5_9BASI|nr:PHB depolymerase family esterase [Testicularia cyperi]
MPGGGGGGGTGKLQEDTTFSKKPTAASMYTYVPQSFKKGNPVVVALHYCGGTAESYFGMTPEWAKKADEKGFMLVYASSPPSENKCWDVSSDHSLVRGGGGDSETISNMVLHAQEKYGASKSQVFVTGSSSGAMLTQVMAATYPDMFAGVAEYSGVPAGCFGVANTNGAAWNATCSGGHLIESGEYWANWVKSADKGYSGKRPKMQLWHGTVDNVLSYQNHLESIKQWATVLGVNPASPSAKKSNDPKSNYETSTWGDNLMAVTATGVGHTVPVDVEATCQFWGI